MKKTKKKQYGCPYYKVNMSDIKNIKEECKVTGKEVVGETLILCDFDYMSCPEYQKRTAELAAIMPLTQVISEGKHANQDGG